MEDNSASLWYVYQADGYRSHLPTIVCAHSEESAIERHKELWRKIFNKPPREEPADETYAKQIDPEAMSPGDLIEL